MKVKTGTWEVRPEGGQPPQQHLTSVFGNPSTSNYWTASRFGLYKYRFQAKEASRDVKTTIVLRKGGYLLQFFVTLLTAVQLINPRSIFRTVLSLLVFTVLTYYLFNPPHHPLLRRDGTLIAESTKPYAVLLLAAAFLLSWSTFRATYPAAFVDRFALPVLVLLLGFSYSVDLLPFIESPPRARIFMIPMAMLTWTVLPLACYVIFQYFPGRWVLRGEIIEQQLSEIESTQMKLNILRKIAGEQGVRSVVELYLPDISAVMGVLGVVSLMLIICFFCHCQRIAEGIRAIRPQPLESNRLTRGFLGLYSFSYLWVLVAAVPAVAVIVYGITGAFPINPDQFFYTDFYARQPIHVDLSYANQTHTATQTQTATHVETGTYTKTATHTQTTTSTRNVTFSANVTHSTSSYELIKSGYAGLDSVFTRVGLPLSHLLSISFYVFLLWPLVFLVGGLGISLCSSGLTWLYHLVFGKWKKVETACGTLSVVVIPPNPLLAWYFDEYTQPATARPGTVLPGMKYCVVLSERVYKELRADPLEALLLHEIFHIRNHDLRVHLLATILSVGFGGQNALLAFRDYSQIERDADDFAKAHVGTRSVVYAINSMKNMQVGTLEQSLSGGTHPNFVPLLIRSKSLENDTDERAAGSHKTTLLQRAVSVFLTPYRLMFGDLVTRTAHLPAHERIARLWETSPENQP